MNGNRKQNSNSNWSGMRSVLLQSLPDEVMIRGNKIEWLTYHWNLVVGKEIAEVSKIDKIVCGHLHVFVKGKEWLPVLDPLDKKIIQKINSRAGESLLNSIVFKVVA